MATATTDNSFCLVTDADQYFDERLHSSAWTDASNDDKARALIQSTRIFRSYLIFNDRDGDKVEGDLNDFDPEVTEVDSALKYATCEMALVLLNEDTQVVDDMEGIASISLPGMSITKGNDKKRVIPSHVFKMISHLAHYRSSGSIEVLRS